MRQQVSVVLYFEKGYIADPYMPEREQLINLQKGSGMNRAKSEEKRAQALRDYLQRQGLSMEDYKRLEVAAQQPWYRKGGEIIVPSHQMYGCMIESARGATATLRPCDPDNLRHVIVVSDFTTGKTVEDGVFARLVMPKSGTGQPLSNQRALRSNPYIEDFHASGTLTFFPNDLRDSGAVLEDFVAWAGQRIGVGASRKMGYGRFDIEAWEQASVDALPARSRSKKSERQGVTHE